MLDPSGPKVAEQIRSRGPCVFRIAIMSPPLVMVIGYGLNRTLMYYQQKILRNWLLQDTKRWVSL